ncbi:hypothetical protein PGT21_004965 [Puccinia graminis f. sp. tritici]|uniref:Uncharacterized protein n=1 Tax=Puccinia graminis f. sp. tritici TaxID=56615 RepID=A0A5B0QHF5_PUCGR|nr:hypothetical protein PGT21_004965 [Puccinia graminis f. sp. tritici]
MICNFMLLGLCYISATLDLSTASHELASLADDLSLVDKSNSLIDGNGVEASVPGKYLEPKSFGKEENEPGESSETIHTSINKEYTNLGQVEAKQEQGLMPDGKFNFVTQVYDLAAKKEKSKSKKYSKLLLFQELEVLKKFSEEHQNPKQVYLEAENKHKIFVEETQKKILILKDLKLMELGYFDKISPYSKSLKSELSQHLETPNIQEWIKSTPHQQISPVAKQKGREFGLSILDEIKKEIVEYEVFFCNGNREDPPLCALSKYLPYLFRTIDFLWKNEFINQDSIREMFQDNRILTRASLTLRKLLSNLQLVGGYDTHITQQWFSPLGLQFFEALDEKTNVRIELELLAPDFSEWRDMYALGFPVEWKEFGKSFSSQRYATHLESEKGPTILKNLVLNKDEFKQDVVYLLKCLIEICQVNIPHLNTGPFLVLLSRKIADFLGFIQTYICPDMIEEVASQLEIDPHIVPEHFITILVMSSKLNDLIEIPKAFKNLNSNQKKTLENYSVDKESLQKYCQRMTRDLYPKFQKSYQDIQGISSSMATWLGIQPDMYDLHKSGLKILHKW